jgi:hypothetical protein
MIPEQAVNIVTEAKQRTKTLLKLLDDSGIHLANLSMMVIALFPSSDVGNKY